MRATGTRDTVDGIRFVGPIRSGKGPREYRRFGGGIELDPAGRLSLV